MNIVSVRLMLLEFKIVKILLGAVVGALGGGVIGGVAGVAIHKIKVINSQI
jgi:outer membrane lipoprotein SlyB